MVKLLVFEVLVTFVSGYFVFVAAFWNKLTALGDSTYVRK